MPQRIMKTVMTSLNIRGVGGNGVGLDAEAAGAHGAEGVDQAVKQGHTPQQQHAHQHRRDKKKYSRYSTRAVSRVRGVSLPFTGPGISALRMFMERSVLPESMVMNTSTPMPPTQWVKLRQNSSPWLMASTSVRMEAPVVVKPLTVSKNAPA